MSRKSTGHHSLSRQALGIATHLYTLRRRALRMRESARCPAGALLITQTPCQGMPARFYSCNLIANDCTRLRWYTQHQAVYRTGGTCPLSPDARLDLPTADSFWPRSIPSAGHPMPTHTRILQCRTNLGKRAVHRATLYNKSANLPHECGKVLHTCKTNLQAF